MSRRAPETVPTDAQVGSARRGGDRALHPRRIVALQRLMEPELTPALLMGVSVVGAVASIRR